MEKTLHGHHFTSIYLFAFDNFLFASSAKKSKVSQYSSQDCHRCLASDTWYWISSADNTGFLFLRHFCNLHDWRIKAFIVPSSISGEKTTISVNKLRKLAQPAQDIFVRAANEIKNVTSPHTLITRARMPNVLLHDPFKCCFVKPTPMCCQWESYT